MQTSKIKRMSKKRINEWLKAIDTLLDRYLLRVNLYGDCPFCRIVDKACLFVGGCIWHFIEGEHCTDFATRLGFSNGATRTKKWIKLRIPMLKNWKKILNDELKRRE